MKLMKSNRAEMNSTVRFGGWIDSISVNDVFLGQEQWTTVFFFHSPSNGPSTIVRLHDDGRLAQAIRGFNPDQPASGLMDLVQSATPVDPTPEQARVWDAFLAELAPAY